MSDKNFVRPSHLYYLRTERNALHFQRVQAHCSSAKHRPANVINHNLLTPSQIGRSSNFFKVAVT